MHMLCLRTSDTDILFKNKTVNVSYSKSVFPIHKILNLAIVPLSDLIQKRVNIAHWPKIDVNYPFKAIISIPKLKFSSVNYTHVI